jgi:hypothetical protein
MIKKTIKRIRAELDRKLNGIKCFVMKLKKST